eukprot:scaffold518_cov429-Pavlova_lutheri.AAC.1
MNKPYSRPPSHAPSSRHPRPGIMGVLKEPFFTKHPSLSHLASWDQVYTTTFLVLQRSRVEHTAHSTKVRVRCCCPPSCLVPSGERPSDVPTTFETDCP